VIDFLKISDADQWQVAKQEMVKL